MSKTQSKKLYDSLGMLSVAMAMSHLKDNIPKLKTEIEEEKEQIANLFIMSNGRQALLKQYIDYINKKMYETDIQIDPNIEKLGEEILQMITILQIKMQMAINYTKKEMEQEIQKEFDEIERNKYRG